MFKTLSRLPTVSVIASASQGLFGNAQVVGQAIRTSRIVSRYQGLSKGYSSSSVTGKASNFSIALITLSSGVGFLAAYYVMSQHAEAHSQVVIPEEHIDRMLKNDADKKRVVVIGGGVAGHRIAYKLQGKADVVLVDPKDYFEVPMAAPREFVNPSLSGRAVIRYSDFLKDVTHVRGKAVDLSEDQLVVEGCDDAGNKLTTTIDFDYAVIATGSQFQNDLIRPMQGTSKQREKQLQQVAAELKDSHDVLIVGGGAVGVEVAGEIIENFPEKRITLVHGRESLVQGTSQSSKKYVQGFLENHGVNLVLEERVKELKIDESGNKVAVTATGGSIPYDIIFWCTGAKADTSYMASSFRDSLDGQGRIVVDEKLKVKGCNNVFAVGDVTALPENKMALYANKHVKVLAYNLAEMLSNKPEKEMKLKSYKPATDNPMMVVSLGSKDGTACLPFGTTQLGFVVKKIKADDLHISQFRSKVGLEK